MNPKNNLIFGIIIAVVVAASFNVGADPVDFVNILEKDRVVNVCNGNEIPQVLFALVVLF